MTVVTESLTKPLNASESTASTEYYYQRGLHTGEAENGSADWNFYFITHLIYIGNPYGEARMQAYEKGYSNRLLNKGHSEEEAREHIMKLKTQAMGRVQGERPVEPTRKT